MKDKAVDRLLYWGLVALFAFGVFGAYKAGTQNWDFIARCEAAGGVPFTPRGGQVCLRPDQVQPMRTEARE